MNHHIVLNGGKDLNMQSRYNFDNARHDEQSRRMQKLEQQGDCFLCLNTLKGMPEAGPPELENAYWYVKKNDFPYKDTSVHLLVVSKQHVSTLKELSIAAHNGFLAIVTECENKYKLDAFSIGMRVGDMRFTGGTIAHLHAHIIVGDTSNPNHEPVRFKMSTKV